MEITVNMYVLLLVPCLIALLSTQGSAQAPVQLLKFTEGDGVTLDCEQPASVSGVVGWTHDDLIISFGTTFDDMNGAYVLDTDTTNHVKIVIGSLRVRDGGRWVCSVAATRLAEIQLMVLSPPSNFTATNDLTPELASDVVLSCSADGSPPPSMVWSRSYPKPYIMLADGSMKGFVRNFSSTTLELNQVTTDQRGEYICVATNGIPVSNTEKVLRRTTYLQLPYLPEVRPTLPIVRVTDGSQAILACVSQAFPATSTASTVAWLKDGQDVGNTAGYAVAVFQAPQNFHGERYISTLTITGVTSLLTGAYVCEFSNSQGIGTATVTLALELNLNPNFGVEN